MTTLTIDQLFTPSPSGVGPNVPPAGSWMSVALTEAASLGLPTTAFQPGGLERTLLSVEAVLMSQSDAVVSLMAQGGFLTFAASGTVTYQALNGSTVTVPVTPDPSIPSQNPTGAPGWLDVLGDSLYDEDRLLATYASGSLAIVNTSAISAGPYDPGSFHVANTNTHKTYANLASLTIPSSIIASSGGVVTGVATGASTTIATQSAHGLTTSDIVFITGLNGIAGVNGAFVAVTGVPDATHITVPLVSSGTWSSGGTIYKCTQALFQADFLGSVSNAGVGSVSTTVTQATGVACFNTTAWSGSDYESNAKYAARCRLKLAAVSPNGPSDAYVYFALTAQKLLAAQTPSVSLSNGAIVSAVASANPSTGIVTTTIASATPASSVLGQPVTPGVADLPIIGATNATPIVIQTSSPHGLSSGNFVTVAGVVGNTNANGTTTVTFVDTTHLSLDNTSGNGTYLGGGTLNGGDLGEVNALIQANVVPDGIVAAITQSALALPVAIAATVTVPAAFAANYRNALANAIAAYLLTLPIGGLSGVVPISGVEGMLFGIGIQTLNGTSYVQKVTGLTLNGVAADLAFPTAQYFAIAGTSSITVVGV